MIIESKPLPLWLSSPDLPTAGWSRYFGPDAPSPPCCCWALPLRPGDPLGPVPLHIPLQSHELPSTSTSSTSKPNQSQPRASLAPTAPKPHSNLYLTDFHFFITSWLAILRFSLGARFSSLRVTVQSPEVSLDPPRDLSHQNPIAGQ